MPPITNTAAIMGASTMRGANAFMDKYLHGMMLLNDISRQKKMDTERQQDRQMMADDRAYQRKMNDASLQLRMEDRAYGQKRDAIGDARYQEQTDYRSQRDAAADARYVKQDNRQAFNDTMNLLSQGEQRAMARDQSVANRTISSAHAMTAAVNALRSIPGDEAPYWKDGVYMSGRKAPDGSAEARAALMSQIEALQDRNQPTGVGFISDSGPQTQQVTQQAGPDEIAESRAAYSQWSQERGMADDIAQSRREASARSAQTRSAGQMRESKMFLPDKPFPTSRADGEPVDQPFVGKDISHDPQPAAVKQAAAPAGQPKTITVRGQRHNVVRFVGNSPVVDIEGRRAIIMPNGQAVEYDKANKDALEQAKSWMDSRSAFFGTSSLEMYSEGLANHLAQYVENGDIGPENLRNLAVDYMREHASYALSNTGLAGSLTDSSNPLFTENLQRSTNQWGAQLAQQTNNVVRQLAGGAGAITSSELAVPSWSKRADAPVMNEEINAFRQDTKSIYSGLWDGKWYQLKWGVQNLPISEDFEAIEQAMSSERGVNIRNMVEREAGTALDQEFGDGSVHAVARNTTERLVMEARRNLLDEKGSGQAEEYTANFTHHAYREAQNPDSSFSKQSDIKELVKNGNEHKLAARYYSWLLKDSSEQELVGNSYIDLNDTDPADLSDPKAPWKLVVDVAGTQVPVAKILAYRAIGTNAQDAREKALVQEVAGLENTITKIGAKARNAVEAYSAKYQDDLKKTKDMGLYY